MSVSTKALIERLQELRRVATLERAGFGFPSEKVNSNPLHDPPIIDMPVTDFIRERTRLYRETWLIGPLDELIEELGAKLAQERRKAK